MERYQRRYAQFDEEIKQLSHQASSETNKLEQTVSVITSQFQNVAHRRGDRHHENRTPRAAGKSRKNGN